MEFHRALMQRDLERSGVDPGTSMNATKRLLGSVALAQDRSRDVWLPPPLQDLSRDIRFAARLLVKERWFSGVAVAMLALGIGGNATLFTIVHGMGGSFPVDRPDRVVSIGSEDAVGRLFGLSYLDFEDWRRATTAFTDVAAYVGAAMNVTDRDVAPDRLAGAYVSANTFRLMGERPLLGRDFFPEDDRIGAAPVVIVGSAIWKSRYHGDPAVIGRAITINGVAATVIGVMPDGFRFPMIHDAWQPLASMPGLASHTRDARTLQAFGRLHDGVDIADARSELMAIGSRLSRDYPDTNTKIRPVVRPRTGGFDLTNPWDAMLAAVVCVLLIGCANVANLLLARGAHRSREIGIRTALGASRWRIARQLMVEHLLLAILAGVLGLGVASLGVHLWVGAMPVANWPYWYRFTIDRQVLVYLAEASLASAMLFGVAPALKIATTAPGPHMRDGGRGATPGASAQRWTSGLLVADFALTLALLAGAGLTVRTLAAVLRADSVVDTSNLLLASLSLPPQPYATAEQRTGFYQRVEDRLATIPALSSATIMSALPFYTAPEWRVSIEGRPAADGGSAPTASYVMVGSQYFETLGLRLLRGRTFSAVDGTPGHEAAIVNQRFASLHFAGANAVGQRIRITDPNAPPGTKGGWVPIIGVSPTVRQHYAAEIDAVVYVPYRSGPGSAMTLMVRGRSNPALTTPVLRDVIRDVDADLPLYNIMPLDQLLAGTRFANRVLTTMFVTFAVSALALSAIGLYAVTAYSVTRRTQEIGVRMALGAQPSQVVWLFVQRVVTPLGLGLGIGLGAAVVLGRVMQGMLIQTSPHDPVTFISITALLIGVALAATWWPARRATQRDPLAALRYE